MFQIDTLSRQPIYEQLIRQVERFILTGVLDSDEQIPSVRTLSMELAVNPNTIQKAYSELDRRGLTYSVPGKGCFVSKDAKQKIGEFRRTQLNEFMDMVGELAMAGITRAEILDCVERAYREKEKIVDKTVYHTGKEDFHD